MIEFASQNPYQNQQSSLIETNELKTRVFKCYSHPIDICSLFELMICSFKNHKLRPAVKKTVRELLIYLSIAQWSFSVELYIKDYHLALRLFQLQTAVRRGPVYGMSTDLCSQELKRCMKLLRLLQQVICRTFFFPAFCIFS